MVTIRFLVPLSAVLIFISRCATGKPIAKFYMVHDFKGTQEFHADKMRCHAWACDVAAYQQLRRQKDSEWWANFRKLQRHVNCLETGYQCN